MTFSITCNLRYQSADMDILLLMNPTLLIPNRVPRFEIDSAEHSRRFVVEIRKQTLCCEEWLKPIAMHLISHSFPDKQEATNCIISTQAINTSTFFHQNLTLVISPFWKCTTQTNRRSIKTRVEGSMPLSNSRRRPLPSHSLGSLLFFRTSNMMKGISAFKKEGTGGVRVKAKMRRRKILVQIHKLTISFYSRIQLVTLYYHAMPSYRPTM
jgi:hypothetical protein